MFSKIINKKILCLFHDSIIALIAISLAYMLRFNFSIPEIYQYQLVVLIIPVVLISFFVFFYHQIYKISWRFISISDIKRIMVSEIYIIVLFFFIAANPFINILYITNSNTSIPFSVFFIFPVLQFLGLICNRILFRYINNSSNGINFDSSTKKNIILININKNTPTIINEIAESSDWKVVAILDNDEKMHKRTIEGVHVEGFISKIENLSKKYSIDRVVICGELKSKQDTKELIEITNNLSLKLLTLPSSTSFVSEKYTYSSIRPVQIEDLLGRDPVELDFKNLINFINNKTCLVSGAGGSIGTEICRQLLKLKPKKVICIDISEASIYKIEQEFNEVETQILYFIDDIKNVKRIEKIFKINNIDIIFHAAAYKHVPLLENGNVESAIKNNVFGTKVLSDLAIDYKVQKFVYVSTDKAVNPKGVMGQTKRLAELICQNHQKNNSSTLFLIVRFGNVLNSSGSVIPKFKEQIASGGPVTVTHKDITRYFMSISEAAQLVIKATFLSKGKEIYVLEMGEPIKIIDLAKQMINLSGFNKDEIDIVITGLRSGEKLYEELLYDEETTIKTSQQKLRISISENFKVLDFKALEFWIESLDTKEEGLIKNELLSFINN